MPLAILEMEMTTKRDFTQRKSIGIYYVYINGIERYYIKKCLIDQSDKQTARIFYVVHTNDNVAKEEKYYILSS